MKRDRVRLAKAEMEWRRGDSREERPPWALRVLDACASRLPELPPAVRTVRTIVEIPERWREAHDAFTAVRRVVLQHPRSEPPTVEHGVLYLAENVAKVTYNASGEPAPFDHDAGWWIAKNA